jgi:ketosteroid isomerase-like protein
MRFWGAFGTHRSEIEDWVTVNDEVVVEVHHSATGKRSGIEVEMRDWHVFTVRGAKIVRWRVFNTGEQALEAAGLSE